MSLVLRLLLSLAFLLLLSCESGSESDAEEEAPSSSAQADDSVVLTIYLATGTTEESMLQPVTREVPVEGDLASRAVELMLAGPVGEEELERPWPSDTELLDVSVDGGVAIVDFSAAALGGGAESYHSGHLEALALAALANTLTEFPTIDEVRVTVEGESPGVSDTVTAFWGGWGLPETLGRDETLVGEEGGGRIPALDDFSREAKAVGSEDAGSVHVRSVRVRDRITYLRVVVEVAAAEDHDSSPPEPPRSYARGGPEELALEVTGVDSIDEDGVRSELDARLGAFLEGLAVGPGQRTNSVRVTLTPSQEGLRDFHLHTRESPTRIILDIRK